MRRDYRKIKAWQLADELVVSMKYRKSDVFGLMSQLKRSENAIDNEHKLYTIEHKLCSIDGE